MQPTRLCRLGALILGLLPLLAGAADTYQYDELGNLQTLTTDTGTRTYSYDEVNRLDQETGPAGVRDHAYDLNGNRTSDGAGTSATYSASTDRLATINGTTVGLDAAGNLTSDGTNTYTWDAAGRLKTVSRANQLWATYYYDYKSRRSRKETTSSAPQGAQVVVYHYDQDDNLLAETLATGAPIKTYIWDDGRLVGLLDHATTPPTLLTLDTDQLGTPRAARTAQGTVVWRWDSDGYGTTVPNEDPDGNGTKTTINLRFPGQYYDLESGLHYNWNRYYSPKLGRYISPDPIGLAGGINTYGYVGGNPLGYTDRFGLLSEALLPSCLFGGPANPVCDVAVIATACKWSSS
jgi:RHS repeat-associated protein